MPAKAPNNRTLTVAPDEVATRSQSEYEAYLHTWFNKVCGKLKPHGSLYLCGDWKCTSALQTVMQEELTVLNRITCQREKGRGAQRNWKNSMEDIWFATAMLRTYSSLVLSNEMYGAHIITTSM